MVDYTNAIETASIEETHSPVTDTNVAILVNADTRTFDVGRDFPSVIGVVGDHNSNVVSFSVPRYIDGHDIFACAEHMILWRNEATGSQGTFAIPEEYIDEHAENEDNIILGWLISEEVTQDVGEILFALRISDYDEDGNLTYRWKTKEGKGLRIESSVFDEEYPPSIPKSYVVLVDQATGQRYKLSVYNGRLVME